MSASLLVTKLYFPPVRPNLVPRPRLVERLQTGLQGPLTLIAAPAGYGKTTLLGEWRASSKNNTPVAWFSLDAGDNDPVRFLLYLTTALDQVQTNLTKNTHLLLQSPELPPVEVIGTALLNELSAFPTDLILAFDDYHTITTAEIHAVLAFLLDHLPPHLHLAILTRADPPLPLARLRARGHLTEIRAADLRFTTQEAAAFLREVMGLSLSAQEIAALETRTEGWIAGLQLAALSMQGQEDHERFITAFSGSHQYIVDYLAEEVLNRQPEFVKDFLLQTSLLERLTGSLCDALTGRADGQATLQIIAQSNLFLIPLDDERRWYRYHHLFADLLRNRLRLDLPEQVVELHRRAAAWYQQQNLTGEAIPHAQAAGDSQFVVDVICKDWLRLARQYRLNVMLQWIESLPEAIHNDNPRLCAVHAFGLWSQGLRSAAAAGLDKAQQILDEKVRRDQANHPEYAVLQAEIHGFRSLSAAYAGELEEAARLANRTIELATGNAPLACAVASTSLYVIHRKKLEMEQVIEKCKQVIEYARKADHHVMVVDAFLNLGYVLMAQGRLRLAKESFMEGVRYIESLGEGQAPAYSTIYVGLAEVYYLQHDLAQAERFIRLGVALSERSGRLTNYLFSHIVETKIRYSMNNRVAAKRIIEDVCQTIQNTGARLYEWDEAGYWRARLDANLGDADLAREWLQTRLAGAGPVSSYDFIAQAIRMAWIYDSINLPGEALRLLAYIKPRLEKSGLNGWLVEIYVLEALCHAKVERKTAALIALRQALELAQPEGYLQVFLDAGLPMRELLLPARRAGIHTEFVEQVLAYFEADCSEEGAAPVAVKQPLISPLSKRELELLELIATGCSNKEIAGKLVISIGTVKRHTVNIFNKLDAKNRTEAVAKARELGIL